MSNTHFESYANLILTKGINMQKGEVIVINSPLEVQHFTKILVHSAYEKGAKLVKVNWNDDEITKMNFKYQSTEELTNLPSYLKDESEYFVDRNASYIHLTGSDPDNLNGIDSSKIVSYSSARSKTVEKYREQVMSDKLKWCIAGVSTKKWAQKVFPNEENAYAKLWVEILKTVRINTSDPIKSWDNHLAKLKAYSHFLTKAKFDKLVFKNSKGTNLEVQLPKNYKFLSGGSTNENGEVFVANMPTEEVFSMPKKDGVNGRVYSSKVLSYNSSLIEDFWFEFKDGKVVDYDARVGKDVLKEIFKVDEGASMLGEVAIVNNNSAISQSNILFYNTLYDENASCHLALGKAYPTCVENGENLTKEELDKIGANDSEVHIDFMFGTEDMSITGYKGEAEVEFFKDGNFVVGGNNE